jgi:hypothetical protein
MTMSNTQIVRLSWMVVGVITPVLYVAKMPPSAA